MWMKWLGGALCDAWEMRLSLDRGKKGSKVEVLSEANADPAGCGRRIGRRYPRPHPSCSAHREFFA